MSRGLVFTAFAFATILDLISTILCLGVIVSHEGNPIMGYILNNFGYIGLALTKASAIIVFYFLAKFMKRRAAFMVGWGVSIVTFTVAMLNFSLLV